MTPIKKQEIKINGTIEAGNILWLPTFEKDQYLEVNINSNGGDAHAAIGMFDMLSARRKKQKIITVGIGQVESAAFWPFICGDERHAYKNTRFMLHDASHSGNNYLQTTMQVIRHFIKFILNPALWRIMQITNKKDLNFWRELLTGKERFFSAREMKKLGIVTKIL